MDAFLEELYFNKYMQRETLSQYKSYGKYCFCNQKRDQFCLCTQALHI